MKKLKLQVQMTIDGYVARPNGDLDWMTWGWDSKQGDYVNELTDSVDTILLGRKMTPGFISYWSNVLKDSKSPEYSFARKMIDKPKVVFSKTINKSDWINTTVANGDLTEEVKKLKSQPGTNIVVYGGASFVSSLIKAGLIDEYHLFVNPVAIGTGLSIFKDVKDKLNLTLIKSIASDNGIVIQHYNPKQS